MKRYNNIPIQNRWDGKRVYKSIKYPTIIPSVSDIQITSKETDYLDTLAHKYYGDSTLWVIIAWANPSLGKGRLSIPPGTNLRIPIDVNGIINEFNRLNKI